MYRVSCGARTTPQRSRATCATQLSAGCPGSSSTGPGPAAPIKVCTSNPYSRRLQLLVNAVHAVDNARQRLLAVAELQGVGADSFGVDDPKRPRLLRASSTAPTPRSTGDSPLGRRSIWQGSRKYSTSDLASISSEFRTKLRILGDESSWSRSRGRYLEGDAYYWSSQNPYDNPQSFGQLAALAHAVRNGPRNPNGSVKAWVAPFAPGFDTQLAGGSTCVPRKGSPHPAPAVRRQPAHPPVGLGADQLERDHRGELRPAATPLRPAEPDDAAHDRQRGSLSHSESRKSARSRHSAARKAPTSRCSLRTVRAARTPGSRRRSMTARRSRVATAPPPRGRTKSPRSC